MLKVMADGWKCFAPFSIDVGRGNGHVSGLLSGGILYDECVCFLWDSVRPRARKCLWSHVEETCSACVWLHVDVATL